MTLSFATRSDTGTFHSVAAVYSSRLAGFRPDELQVVLVLTDVPLE